MKKLNTKYMGMSSPFDFDEQVKLNNIMKKTKQLKSEIKLTGGKLNGWYIHVSDNYGYKEDFTLTHEELVMLKKLIDKKIDKGRTMKIPTKFFETNF